MKIGIIGLMHESNTFIGAPTEIEDFRNDMLLVGNQIRDVHGTSHHEVRGFLETLDSEGVEAKPILFARSLPGGTISAAALDYLVETMLAGLKAAGPLDGVLTAPHGANVSANHPDMDGYWLSVLRDYLGDGVPIVSTLDPHANLSPLMVDSVDAIIAYRTNPHLDQRQRGREAASLLIRTIRGEVHPVIRASFPNISINIERQAPSAQPCRQLYDLADRMLARPGVLSNSILLGFPYSDVEKMGSSFVTVTDGDPDLAQQLSDELAASLRADRKQFVGEFISPAEAIGQAMTEAGPVCLLDMGDNVGGGSPGDSVILAHEFERYVERSGSAGRLACISIYDAEAAGKSIKAGPGGRLKLRIGGKHHSLYGPTLEAGVEVVSVHEGTFTEQEVRHYGMTQFVMGPTAIVRTDRGLVVQLTSRRVYPASLKQLTSCGIEPGQFQILVAKGVHAPVAAYAPVSRRLIRVNTPGPTCADMRQLAYHNRRHPLFPFEDA